MEEVAEAQHATTINKMKKKTIIITMLVLLAAIFFISKGTTTGNATQTIPLTTGITEIPLTEITEEAKWYEYDADGKKVKFFAVKSSDGSIKTAFDACDVCYGSKKGYRQEGAQMICNNCGNKYPISGLGTENRAGGGCWPGYLPSEIQGGTLVIKHSDIEAGKYRF